MAKAMGVKFVPVNTAWDGIIPALVTDKFDIIMGGMTITQERNLKVNFADPYIVVGQAILLNKKHEGTVKSYKDLNDPKYVLTSRMGTTGEQAIKRMIPKATYKGFESEAEGGMEVINGKADALVYDLPFVGTSTPARARGKTVSSGRTVHLRTAGLGHQQGRPRFPELAEQLPRQCKGDGFYEKVYNKWILSSDWKKELRNRS
jgi:polar amino acid transport system substrate-binding protein